MMQREFSGIEQVVALAGGQACLARQVGVTQQAVASWLRRGYVPVRRVIEIESQYGVDREKLVCPRLLNLLGLKVCGESAMGLS